MINLSQLLRSVDMRQFNLAVAKLSDIDKGEAIALLEELAREKTAELRCRAIAAMAHISDERAEVLAIKSLHDSDSLVRVNAVDVLRKLGSQPSVSLISSLLSSDPDDLVRSWAAFSLGQIGDASVLPSLRAAVERDEGTDHEGRPISETAQLAIEKIISRLTV